MLGWLPEAAAILTGLAALWVAVRGKKEQTQATTTNTHHNEVVDADVLGQFMALTTRVTDLEVSLLATRQELTDTKAELKQAIKDLSEMQKIEEFLRASLHEKDKQLTEVRVHADEKQKEIDLFAQEWRTWKKSAKQQASMELKGGTMNWHDILERALWTALQGALAALPITELITDVSGLKALGIAALTGAGAALLSFIKTLAQERLGLIDTRADGDI